MRKAWDIPNNKKHQVEKNTRDRQCSAELTLLFLLTGLPCWIERMGLVPCHGEGTHRVCSSLQHRSVFFWYAACWEVLTAHSTNNLVLITHEMHEEKNACWCTALKGSAVLMVQARCFLGRWCKSNKMNMLAPSSLPALRALQDTMYKNTAATSSFNNEQPVMASFGDFICTALSHFWNPSACS